MGGSCVRVSHVDSGVMRHGSLLSKVVGLVGLVVWLRALLGDDFIFRLLISPARTAGSGL